MQIDSRNKNKNLLDEEICCFLKLLCIVINLVVCNLIVCLIESLKQKDKLRCRQWFKGGFQIKRERRECWRARAEKATGRRRKKRQNRRVLGSREGREDS